MDIDDDEDAIPNPNTNTNPIIIENKDMKNGISIYSIIF